LIRLVSGGGDGIFVATQYNFVGHYVLMTDPSINRLEDLRGKRIALDPTSPTYGYMLKALEQVGLKKDDVTFVQFGTAGQPERAMAVLRKQARGHYSNRAEYLCGGKAGTEKVFDYSRTRYPPTDHCDGDAEKIFARATRCRRRVLARLCRSLAYVKSQRDVTMRVIAKYTRHRDPEVLGKFYDDLVPDLPRMPYIDEASARATVEAMQIQGPPLPKVDVKTLFDNSLLKGLENDGFVERLKPR